MSRAITRIGAWQQPRRLKLYRYRLGFEVNPDGRGKVAFIGLNPSTASLTTTDPTVDSFCRGFAVRLGFRELEMLNLFGLRSTDKMKLLEVRDPVGPGNDRMIIEALVNADLVVAAWGAEFHPLVRRRADELKQLLHGHANGPVMAIKLNRDGSPSHPLYQPLNRRFVTFPL